MAPFFLELVDVLSIHRDQLERYGGAPGIRDAGLLEAAVEQARAGFGGEYLHRDLPEMAAASLYHLVRNHPFVDGNESAGAVAALVFLDLNGVRVDMDEDELAELVEGVAAGRFGKEEIAATFRRAAAPPGGP